MPKENNLSFSFFLLQNLQKRAIKSKSNVDNLLINFKIVELLKLENEKFLLRDELDSLIFLKDLSEIDI